mgnify:CR=1 FL=1
MHLSALIGTYRNLTELIGILRLGGIVDLQSKISGLIWTYLAISGHNWTEVDNELWRCSRFVGRNYRYDRFRIIYKQSQRKE